MRRFPVTDAPQPSRNPARPSGAAAKLWFFRAFTALVIPIILLLLLEVGLRFTHHGRPTGFFIPDDQPGFLRTNPDYVSLFLPGSFDLRPLNYRFAEKKPPNTVRIVVLGESAVEGIPVPMFAFAPQMRALLRARYPAKNIEVINTGVVAINSHVVYQIARDAARCAPDLFVVYMGNNEVVGPYGPGCSYLSTVRPLWAIRLGGWLRSTRTGRLVGSVLTKLAGMKKAPEEWGGMAMFLDHAVRGDDPRLEGVYRNFEANLRDIMAVATGAGARTLVCTVVSNLKDSPPFLSLHRADLTSADLVTWQRAFDEGRLAWKLGERDLARARLAEAWRLDPQYAETAFMLGSLALQADHTAEARKYFVAAQEWDALRFRPSPRINQSARAVAREQPGVILVDAARELGSDPASPGAMAGRELLFEHVHPDWEGNNRLARLMAAGVAQALFAGQAGEGTWLDSPATAAAVGYTPVERFNVLQRAALITRHAPFPNQLTYAADQARNARETAAAEAVRRDPAALRRAAEVVHSAAERDPGNPDLARLEVVLADDLGELPGALAQIHRAQSLQPANFALATDAAIKQARLGRFAEAEQQLLATAAACAPRDLDKMTPALADFYTRTKRFADGRRWFERAMQEHPDSQPLRFYRGRLAQGAGDLAVAESDYRAALVHKPDNETALEALVALLHGQGRPRELEDLCVQYARLQPDNQANDFRAAQIFEVRNQPAEAAKALLAATRSGPVPLPVHLRLANLFFGLQRRGEVLDRLATAWQLAREENDREVTDSISELIRRMRTQP